MKKVTALSAIFLALAGGAFSSSALASYGKGDIYTRVGVAKVDPKSDNGNFNSIGVSDVDVDSDRGAAFTLGYRFMDKVGIELLAAEPFEHDIALDGANIASTKHLPPTLTVQYYPLGGTTSPVQPYAGVGVNYTHFSDEHVNGGNLELDDSWGVAAQLGVDLLLDDHWALNAAAWYLDIDTDATATIGGSSYDTTVDIDPLVVMGGISYRF
ncbi:OmpW/AlkL family protein [Halomonas caseinilytica]|uniref:OmpW/AlkL family protein n=1 Tax=Halomonas caseinilytica TaxID=438744 RepID=UPI0007E5AB88|nr:OmpW family outer membrane protein [Halomonas caseinilytica]SEN01605.1 outer membrane protein [Halomonas caseinilytica]